MNSPRSVEAVVSLAVTLLFMSVFSTGNIANAHCSGKHTGNHPHCDSGGDPGGGETTCATSTTFPTFAYWENGNQSSIPVLSLSDAAGTCTRALTEFDTENFLAGETAFHFDRDTQTGRVVWTNHFVADYLLLVEFDVDAGNTVNVRNDSQAIVALPGVNHSNGTMRNVDIGTDGDLMTFIYRPPIPDGSANEGGYTIYTASIDGCSSDPWTPSAGTDCSGTLAEVISAPPDPDGTYYWRDLSFSTDDSKIYLSQFLDAQGDGAGTYVVERNIEGNWGSLTPVTHVPFPSTIATIDYDGSGDREVLATGITTEANPCGELAVVDIEDCVADSSLCNSIGGLNILGSNPSWLSADLGLGGQFVYVERIYKRQGKNYSCKTGNISIANPFDSSTIPVNLFNGRDPLSGE